MLHSQQKPYKPSRYQLKRHRKHGTSGLAVIFAFEKFLGNEKDRDGAGKEIEYLVSFFEQLNLRVNVLKDLTLPLMELALKVISNPNNYQHDYNIPDIIWNSRVSREDSMSFIAITSHGDNTCFKLSDGNTMKDIDLEKYFHEDVCSFLAGCPKLYLYNKCRNYEGERERYEMASLIETIETDGLSHSTANSAIPDLNMLAVYTCAEGIQSLRIPSSGSLILYELPIHYSEYGRTMEVIEFFSKFLDKMCCCIGEKVERNDQKQVLKNVTQIPSLERITLRYKLYFDSPDPGNRDNELRHETTHSTSDMDSAVSCSQFHSTNQHRIASSQKAQPTKQQITDSQLSSLHNPVPGSHDTHTEAAQEGWQ